MLQAINVKSYNVQSLRENLKDEKEITEKRSVFVIPTIQHNIQILPHPL